MTTSSDGTIAIVPPGRGLPMADEFDVVRALQAAGVRVVVIGGHAVSAQGFIRGTEDIDLIWQRTPDSELALAKVFESINAQHFGNDIDPVTRLERTYPASIAYVRCNHVMILISDVGFIDLFDFVPEVKDQNVAELIDTATVVNGIPFVSLKWLRRMKAKSSRYKDQRDLENLPPDDPAP